MEIKSAVIDSIQFGVLSRESIEKLSYYELDVGNATKKHNVFSDSRLGTTRRDMLCGTCNCDYNTCTLGHFGHLKLAECVPNGELYTHLYRILSCVCYRCARLLVPKDSAYYKHIQKLSKKERLKYIFKVCRKRMVVKLKPKADQILNSKLLGFSIYCESNKDRCDRRKESTKMRRMWNKHIDSDDDYNDNEDEMENEVENEIDYEYEEEEIEEKYEEEEEEENEEDDDISEVDKIDEVDKGDDYCGSKQPLWILHDGVVIRPVFDFNDKSSSDLEVFTMYDMYLMLKNISREDIELMGLDYKYSHPVSLLWQVLPVPSNAIRPSHIGHTGINQSVKEDDMTLHLKRITKFNTKLSEALGANDQKHVPIQMYVRYNGELISENSVLYDMYVQLYTYIGNYQTSKIKVYVSQYGRKLKSLHDLWLNSNNKHSRNRLKNDVAGKRMQFAARAVLCPEESMHIHDVRIPKDMAMKLTTNEVVTRYNIASLTDIVRRGTNQYPGANYVCRAGSGDTISLDNVARFSLVLSLGDVVERHAVDGDIVLMIRQPTLHKFSFMAHRVVVDYTHNNNTIAIHPAVTPCYNADFDGDEMNLMMVQSSEAKVEAQLLMLVDQNIMKDDVPIVTFTQNSVAAAYIMTSDYTFVKRDDLVRLASVINTVVPGNVPERITGKECFSRLLLPSSFNMSIGTINIRDGIMLSGQWTKKLLNCHGGLIHSFYMHYGLSECANFITRMYRCMDWYIQYIRGLTVSVNDCMVSNNVLQIDSLKRAVDNYLEQFPTHRPDVLTTLQDVQQEKDICKVLDTIREITSNRGIKYLKSKEPNSNGLLTLTESGSKGSMTNVTQIVSTVGQQRNYQSKRYPSVSYHKYDHSVRHGMIFNSFTAGMSVPENYSQLRSGRSGLIETAVNTSVTGYSHKRMAKSMEDIVINEYGHVINTYGQILQLSYGSDGFSPSYLYRVQLKTLTMSKLQIRQKYEYDLELAEFIIGIRHELLNNVQIMDDSYITVHTPFKLVDDGCMVRLQDKLRIWDSLMVCKKLKLKLYFFETQFDPSESVIHDIRIACLRARVPVGDSVGEHAAQSIGEPTTQITLNSFHSSGDASNLSTGVPRIKEIINATKNIQTPSMRIYLKHGDYNEYVKFGDMLVEKLFESIVVGSVVTDRTTIYNDRVIMNRIDLFRQNVELSTYKQILENFLFQSPDVSVALFTVNNMTSEIAVRMDNLFHNSMHLCFVYDTNFLLVLFDSMYLDLNNDRVHTLYMVIDHVLKAPISGVNKIYDYEISQAKQYRIDEETGVSQWVETLSIVTLGSNITHVMNLPNVDTYRTYSNDIMESEQIFGILGSESLILSELTNVMASNGASVTNRHILLMADRMTSMGVILSTLYNGICTDGTSALRNMTFENTPLGMVTGALHAQHDPCNGPFECIILNHKIRAGTGIVKVIPRDIQTNTNWKANIDKCLIVFPDDNFFKQFARELKIQETTSNTECTYVKVTVPKTLKREKRKHTEIEDTENRKRRLSTNSFSTQNLSNFPYKFEQTFVPSSPIDEVSFFNDNDHKVFEPFEE